MFIANILIIITPRPRTSRTGWTRRAARAALTRFTTVSSISTSISIRITTSQVSALLLAVLIVFTCLLLLLLSLLLLSNGQGRRRRGEHPAAL